VSKNFHVGGYFFGAGFSSILQSEVLRAVPTNTWTRISSTIVLPTASVESYAEVGLSGASVGNTIWVTGAQVEKDSLTNLLPAINSSGIITNGYEWISTANNGPSIRYDQTDYDTLRIAVGQNTYLGFSPNQLVGTLERAILRLYMHQAGTVRVKAQLGSFTSYDTLPTFSGSVLSYTNATPNTWIDLDITSLLLSGMADYVIELSTLGGTTLTFGDGSEAIPMPPTLLVDTDPLSSTQPLPFAYDIVGSQRVNLQRNPSFEADLTDWQAENTATITRVAGGTAGSWCANISASAVGSGIRNSGTIPYVTPLSTYTLSVDIKKVSGQAAATLLVEGFNASVVSTGTITTKAITVTANWMRHYITFTAPSGTERARLKVVYAGTAAAYVWQIDNVLLELGPYMGAAFNGDTVGAVWDGTANLSTSRMSASRIKVTSSYIGDSNENNTASFYYRRSNEATWLRSSDPLVVNRTLKSYTSYIGASIGNHNLVQNPSLEVSDVGWGGGTRVTEDKYIGEYSYKGAASSSVYYSIPMQIIPSGFYSVQLRIKASESVFVRSFEYTAAEVFVTSKDSSAIVGDGSWKWLTHVFTAGATSALMTFQVVATDGTISSEYYVDAAQVNRGVLLDYRDGTFEDAIWEGNPHLSTTGIRLLDESPYELSINYYDVDGFFDMDDSSFYNHAETYITPKPADNHTTVLPLIFNALEDMVYVTSPYEGDDNNNNLVRIEFKRADLSTWSEVPIRYDRNSKKIFATITNLKGGTEYTVRAFYTDTDGVYGASNNIISGNVATLFTDSGVDTDPRVTFGGFVLMGREDGKIGVISHDAFGFPERRMRVEDLPRLDGAIELQSLWGKKQINIRGFISGDSRSDLDEVRGALARGLAPRSQRLVVDSLSAKGRFYYATCDSLSIEESAEENIRHLYWNAGFTCADPFAYDISETILPTFTINNTNVSFTNAGDALVSPYISMTTPIIYPSSVVVTNNTTGERIAPKATIVSGDRLIIDTERRSLLKNGVEIDYAGSFPRLAVGPNEFHFSLSVTRTTSSGDLIQDLIDLLSGILNQSVVVDVRWRNKYL
jgi:hypothetical protein